MNLAVFDIDGTLTRTNAVDGRCFARAFREELGIAELDDDWSSYVHRTDSGIAAEIYRRHLGRPASPQEDAAVQKRFLRLLADAAAREPEAFRAVPGAGELLAALPGRGWAVALATGCWRRSAEFKLTAAGLGSGWPLATSDGMESRREIVAAAVGEARRAAGVDRFERVVSLGDGVWDLEVARQLGLGFVGLTIESDGGELRAAGASHLLVDYTQREEAFAALAAAAVPEGRG